MRVAVTGRKDTVALARRSLSELLKPMDSVELRISAPLARKLLQPEADFLDKIRHISGAAVVGCVMKPTGLLARPPEEQSEWEDVVICISGEVARVNSARKQLLVAAKQVGEPAPTPVPVSGEGGAVHPPWRRSGQEVPKQIPEDVQMQAPEAVPTSTQRMCPCRHLSR